MESVKFEVVYIDEVDMDEMGLEEMRCYMWCIHELLFEVAYFAYFVAVGLVEIDIDDDDMAMSAYLAYLALEDAVFYLMDVPKDDVAVIDVWDIGDVEEVTLAVIDCLVIYLDLFGIDMVVVDGLAVSL